MRAAVLNAIGFQAVWFCAVIGAGRGHGWTGPAAAAVFVALTLRFGGRREQDLGMLAIAVVLGMLLDTLWVRLGWLAFASPWPEGVAPPWIVSMWAGFALTLNHSLARLASLPWLAALLGGLGGPLAYLAAGRAFGAVEFTGDLTTTLLALGLAWAMTVPLLYAAARRLRPSPMPGTAA